MKKKILLMTLVASLIAGGTTALAVTMFDSKNVFSTTASDVPTSGAEYDLWCNDWSEAGHVYFHYNRGDKNDYNDFCLWIWNDDTDTAGTLWAYNGNPQVSSTLSLVPMSDHWMTKDEVGLSGSEMHKDNFGVIADVDMTKTLYGGKLKTGQKKEAVSYDDPYCNELGFLFPKAGSMDGSSHWQSDGGTDNAVSDWRVESYWRDVDGGKCLHIFLSSGALDTHSFFAGAGAPTPQINPFDADETGSYSSVTESIPDTYGLSSTSNSFKELGIGYQIFVASFRDSNGDGLGDIRGIIDSLDYLDDLGVECLWLTPIQKSDSYHGYDITDYYQVDSKFGTVDDYRELIYKAHKKGIKVIMDLVLNHTSKRNVWFKKSQWGVNSGVPGAKTDDTGINWRNVYTWKWGDEYFNRSTRNSFINDKGQIEYSFGSRQPIKVKDDSADPNGPSWFRDGTSNYYYYGKFGSSMPEINYDNADTRKLVTDMAKYWLSFGLDGFRLDAVKHIYMADEVNPSSSDIIINDTGTKYPYDEELGTYISQPYDYSSNLTKNVAFWKEFANELKSTYPECFLVGENFDGYGVRTAPFYQALDSQFDFANYYHIPAWMYTEGGSASAYASKEASETYDAFSGSGPFTLATDNTVVEGGRRSDFINGAFTSNHDVMRAINQANGSGTALSTTANDNIRIDSDHPYIDYNQRGRAKVQTAVTLLNPGLSWIYYGDELGMSSNTCTHVDTYGNENSMDIWYRQPFLWRSRTLRPDYTANGFKFELDDYNQAMSDNADTLMDIGFDTQGKVYTQNDMYHYYKGLTSLKKLYPAGAKVTFTGSTQNILVINVFNTSGKQTLKILINCGISDAEYLLNPGQGFKTTPIAKIGCDGQDTTLNAPFTYWYGVVAYEAN